MNAWEHEAGAIVFADIEALDVAVFAPLIIETDAELTQRAPLLWQTIQQAPLGADTRETLSEVLEFWFFERFSRYTDEEIWTMPQAVQRTLQWYRDLAIGASAHELCLADLVAYVTADD